MFNALRNAIAVVLATVLLIPASAGALSPFVPYYNLQFATGSAEPDPEVLAYVELIVVKFDAYKLKKLIVTGHTDLSDKVAPGTDLSEARARTVVALLIDKGVPVDAIEVHWVQDTEPLIVTDEPEPMNRRVEVDLILGSETVEQVLTRKPGA